MKTILIVLLIFLVIPFFLYFYGRVVASAVINTVHEKRTIKKEGYRNGGKEKEE